MFLVVASDEDIRLAASHSATKNCRLRPVPLRTRAPGCEAFILAQVRESQNLAYVRSGDDFFRRSSALFEPLVKCAEFYSVLYGGISHQDADCETSRDASYPTAFTLTRTSTLGLTHSGAVSSSSQIGGFHDGDSLSGGGVYFPGWAYLYTTAGANSR